MEGVETWQLIGTPLYVTIRRAARISGISEAQLREWAADAREPLPHIVQGNRKYIRVAALPAYLKSKEAARS